MERSVDLFYSYAHDDERLRKKLDMHLALLQQQGLITTWYDRNINAGTEWASEIHVALNSSQIILLLISASFLASPYCYSKEMMRALERHASGEACVIPIILRPVDWQSAPFSRLQALPTGGKPIAGRGWHSQDEAFLDVSQGIRNVVKELSSKSSVNLELSQQMQASETVRLEAEEILVHRTLPKLGNLPYRRNLLFTGREEILKDLHKMLLSSNTERSQPLALSGLGGVGKTQIALEYVHRYLNDYDTVFWVRSDTDEMLRVDFEAIARVLDLPEKEEPDTKIVITAVIHWLEEHMRWLLIFDNADDLSVLRNFLPRRTSGHIIITTRVQATGSLTSRIEIETMTREQGAIFLLRRAKIITTKASPKKVAQMELMKAEEISEVLGNLPLALDQAGAYIEETGCSLSSYLDLYDGRSKILLRRSSQDSTPHPQSVSATFALCFQKVEKANKIAADLLRLCAFFPDPDLLIEESLIKHFNVNSIEWNAAIEELLRYSLVKRYRPQKALSIHRLVQAVMKDEMDDFTQHQWQARAQDLLTPRPAHLVLEYDGKITSKYPLQGKPVLTIGRLSGNDIQLPFQQISRLHAKLRLLIGIWQIEDMGSLNGMAYRGHRIDRHILSNGDRIYFTPKVALQYIEESSSHKSKDTPS